MFLGLPVYSGYNGQHMQTTQLKAEKYKNIWSEDLQEANHLEGPGGENNIEIVLKGREQNPVVWFLSGSEECRLA